jgi:hypothetical protein
MAKAPTLKTDHADEWAPPAVNADGYEVDKHGLPTSRVARAIHLAKDGAKADQAAAAEYRVKRDWGEDAKVSELATAMVAVPPVEPADEPPADGKGA